MLGYEIEGLVHGKQKEALREILTFTNPHKQVSGRLIAQVPLSSVLLWSLDRFEHVFELRHGAYSTSSYAKVKYSFWPEVLAAIRVCDWQ